MPHPTLHNDALIKSMAALPDLNLTEVGLRNAVLRIGTDCYALFIRRLMREIQPAVAVDVKPQADANSTFAKAAGFLGDLGRGVKLATRRVGEY